MMITSDVLPGEMLHELLEAINCLERIDEPVFNNLAIVILVFAGGDIDQLPELKVLKYQCGIIPVY
jgi:hypothetical protein